MPDLSNCRRVLIIKPSSLGDIVHALPSVHLLKRRFPDIRFTWLVNRGFAPLLEGNPDLEGTLIFPREEFRGLSGMGRFARWMTGMAKKGPWEAALDFQGLLRSGLMTRACGARRRVGLSDSREGARFFHNEIIRVDPEAHAIDRYLALPRALGAEGPAVFPLPEGSAPPGLPKGVMLEGTVVLHPFSRGKGKSLTAAQTVRLCEELAPVLVLLAGQSRVNLSGLPGNVINLLNGTTLPELIWMMRRARAVVSVDSGPMHIAAALMPEVLGIHTWSDPRKVGPWHPGTWVWKAGRLMRTGSYDPDICSRNLDFPDTAIPEIAGWVRERVSGAAGERQEARGFNS